MGSFEYYLQEEYANLYDHFTSMTVDNQIPDDFFHSVYMVLT